MANMKSATRQANVREEFHQPAAGEFAPGHDIVEYLKEYAREKPEVAALWCFGIGFILGWKLKPW